MSWFTFYSIAATACLGAIVWDMSGIYRRLRRLEEQFRLLRYRIEESSSDESSADKAVAA